MLMCKSVRSRPERDAGAPSNSARAAVVFGNAMTSRSEPAPASCIAITIEPERDAAVRRRARAKPFEQEAETRLRRRVVDARAGRRRATATVDR